MSEKKSRMSSFGTNNRINYNSEKFYNRALYENIEISETGEIVENKIPKTILNQIYCQDSRDMNQLPDNSVHLIITSPPYNVGKDYDEDLSLNEYLSLLQDVFSETRRVLIEGGRVCINVANLGRKPYIPLHSYIINIMTGLGFFMRGEIIWDKSASAGTSTAWGSWMSASNPTLRDVHEYILVFSKELFKRYKKDKDDSITKEEFLEYTKSIWSFPAESAKRVGHPAPFPEELPNRLIQLYSFEGDVVIDPFCGSGTTCLSASKLNRNYIGFDISEKYVEISKNRIETYEKQIGLL
jgi:site-specific DNA-methyltransferase (adenine-specific)